MRNWERSQKLLSLIKKWHFDNIALFEYHDEPLATSNKLDKKVKGTIIRKRFTQARQLVNQELLKKEKQRIGQEFIGYITDVDTSWQDVMLVVRPELSAPDIDPYDEITLDKVTAVYNENNSVDIGDKINYIA